MEDTILRRTWAEIDLDALEHNYNVARQKIGPGVKYLGVVKADAYGHGDNVIARVLQEAGAAGFAVSSLGEGRHLRRGGITTPILILGYADPTYVYEDLESARALMRRLGAIVVHTENRAVEETAQEILRYYERLHPAPTGIVD